MQSKTTVTLFELTLCAMYGAMMVASKYILEFLPNVHLLGMFVVLFTFVYRTKALLTIYVFAFIMGVTAGFNIWWVPYLYIWTILWGAAMLIPKNISKRTAMIVFPIVCSVHGFLYGTLYAPFQAFAFGFNFEQTLAWIASGIPWDIVHGVSNFALGLLVWPLSQAILKAHKYIRK